MRLYATCGNWAGIVLLPEYEKINERSTKKNRRLRHTEMEGKTDIRILEREVVISDKSLMMAFKSVNYRRTARQEMSSLRNDVVLRSLCGEP